MTSVAFFLPRACVRHVLSFSATIGVRTKKILKNSSSHYSFDTFIENVATPNSWGDEICQVAISVLIERPIYVYSLDPLKNIPHSTEYCINDSLTKNPISIGFMLNHFVALLPKEIYCRPPKPAFNQFLARYYLKT